MNVCLIIQLFVYGLEAIGGDCVGAQVADLMATLYDVGGIFGKIDTLMYTCTLI